MLARCGRRVIGTNVGKVQSQCTWLLRNQTGIKRMMVGSSTAGLPIGCTFYFEGVCVKGEPGYGSKVARRVTVAPIGHPE